MLLVPLIFSLSLNSVHSYTWENVVTITGSDDKTSQIFEVEEDARFVWTTTYDDEEWALFAVFVFPEGEDIMFESEFEGLSGESYFYDTGNFYLEVICANLNSWQITVQEKNYAATSDPNGEDTELTTTEIIIGAVVFVGIAGGIIAYSIIRKKKSQKRIQSQDVETFPKTEPVKPGLRFCTQCGAQNDESVSFCINCGAKIRED